ncbi:hypothetical protein FRC11_002748 [Ceratobasidium sp. 423]|nr:hypothetical protein FRC11_002748 [Ceratobasidium sp. 423]
MPAEIKKKCFCCGKKLTARSRLEHRKAYLAGFAAATAAAAAATGPNLGPNPIPGPAESATLNDDDDIADLLTAVATLVNADDPPAGDNLGGPTEETDAEVEELLPTLADISMHNEGPPTPPTPPQPVQGLCDNPPATIVEWPELDDVLEYEASDEDGPTPVDDPDRDPIFVEQHQPPTSDPVHEPLLTDEEMLEILEMELGDLEDTDEWVDMCKLTYPGV